MKIRYEVDHSSVAILLGEAQNSKSFSDRAWGSTSFKSLCERFYGEFEKSPMIDIERIKEIIASYKIDKTQTFDNFALDYIVENIKEYGQVKY